MIGKNNPLNIRTSQAFNWNGQTGATRGFCDFESVNLCRRAGAYLLMRSYRRAKCLTIETILNRFAPSSENDTNAYIAYVCKRTGMHKDWHLCFDTDYASVLAAMEIVENGIEGSRRETYFYNARAAYLTVIHEFNLKAV